MSGLIDKSWISSNAGIVIAMVASAIVHVASAYSYFYLSKAQPAQVQSNNHRQQIISFTVVQPAQTESLVKPQAIETQPKNEKVSSQQKPPIMAKKDKPKPRLTPVKTDTSKQTVKKIEKKPLAPAIKTAKQLDNTQTFLPPQTKQHNEIKQLIVETTALKEIEERYITEVLNQIEKNKFYPRKARKRNIEGTVMITLAIDNKGQIASMELSESHKILRKAAKKAIQKAQPFNKPPPSLVSPKTVSFGMTYRFRDF